jgi:mono/diheme cytochrome c family protein
VADQMDPQPRDHTDGEYMNKRSNDHLIKVIKSGGPGVRKSAYMPAFGHVLSETDIWNLVAYLRAIAKPAYKEKE